MSVLSPNRLKGKFKEFIEPQLHLRVPFKAGIYQNSPRWSNKDLDPVPVELRLWGPLDYWAYWCSDMLAPPLASTVSAVVSLGFTARQTIPIVFFGFAICSVVITLTGKMGATYNIPYPVIVRSVFGMFAAGLLCFFLYWIAQTFLALMPIKKLRILFFVKAIVVPPTFLALFLWAAIVTHGGGPLVNGPVKLTSSYMNTAYSALTGLNVIIGLFSSLAVNMPDFGRFSRDQFAGYHQFLALPIIGTLGALTPIFVTSAHQYLWGSFQWYMPAVIEKFDSRAAKFFTAFSFMLATIGNQVAAGTYPFSNDVSGMYPKYINIFRATLIISIFCVVSTPWNIIKNAAGLLSFLSGYSCLMGPLAGTMVCDYYLIKKQKLNVHELYKDHGIYWYDHGFNWRAFASFLCGFIPVLPGFAKSINTKMNIGGAWKVSATPSLCVLRVAICRGPNDLSQIYTFAWLFGFTIAVLVYYVICTYISPPTSAMVDVAVYPPQKGDVSPDGSGEEVEYDEKGGARGSAKEVSPV
ncbi:hypothetical protein GP486_004938 [Trichoglossum hirsutum]|uniref:Allantoin permease n=1 Tax=Trichoglossum hirsutum TaxID=265104 RepID=A0A9P8LA65_9PEZI|nr:hypothetical protein GP486_004938 [Trichoglossum hirsutum]